CLLCPLTEHARARRTTQFLVDLRFPILDHGSQLGRNCLLAPDALEINSAGRRPGRSRFHIDLGRNTAGHKPSEFAARCSNRLLSGNATAKRKPVGAGKSYASVSRRPGKAVWNRSHPESHQGIRDHCNSLMTKVASPFGAHRWALRGLAVA